jgi:hypothetical protein
VSPSGGAHYSPNHPCVAEVACSTCGASVGRRCRKLREPGFSRSTHQARVTSWRATLRKTDTPSAPVEPEIPGVSIEREPEQPYAGETLDALEEEVRGR